MDDDSVRFQQEFQQWDEYEKMSGSSSDIQKKLNAPKGQFNSFGKYHYRSCEDILTAAKPLLDGGLVLTVDDDMVLVGNRIYVKSTATISDGDFMREDL